MPNIPEHWEELTLMSQPEDIVNEFVKKYKGTWVWFCPDKEKAVLCMFKKTTINDSNETIFHFTSNEFGTLTCKLNSKVVIKANFPETGCFTTPHEFGVFYKIPARQYRKAPTIDNSYIASPDNDLYSGAGMRNMKLNRLSEESLQNAYEAKHITLHKGLRQIQTDKRNGFSLTNSFGVSRHPNKDSKFFILWKMTQPVAEINHEKIIIKVPEMKQEIIDLVARQQIGVQID